ncbi:MAG: hypothetical protein IH586_19175, partial [Anaerolineaceae bacterium]|nr:hypothetical protein [Anaerolineaceae bacterium]
MNKKSAGPKSANNDRNDREPADRPRAVRGKSSPKGVVAENDQPAAEDEFQEKEEPETEEPNPSA